MNLRALAVYRFSAWLLTMGQFLVAFFAFLSLRLLFDRFGSIAGPNLSWTFAEVCLCFAVTNIAFSLSECFARGFDSFSRMILKGDFDRILLRPRSTILQIFGSGFELTRIGKLLQGLLVLAAALSQPGFSWGPAKVFTLIFMIAGGVAIFSGLFITGAAVCFFTIEGLELINIFTDGGRELASYPLPVYGKWMQRFFTFIIPFGCINYLPLMYLSGRAFRYPLLYMTMPVLGFLFLLPCILIWQMGVRHYTSTGSYSPVLPGIPKAEDKMRGYDGPPG
jgi:ABC-2 type transport system permease protein